MHNFRFFTFGLLSLINSKRNGIRNCSRPFRTVGRRWRKWAVVGNCKRRWSSVAAAVVVVGPRRFGPGAEFVAVGVVGSNVVVVAVEAFVVDIGVVVVGKWRNKARRSSRSDGIFL